jgi:hypothetical protein
MMPEGQRCSTCAGTVFVLPFGALLLIQRPWRCCTRDETCLCEIEKAKLGDEALIVNQR